MAILTEVMRRSHPNLADAEATRVPYRLQCKRGNREANAISQGWWRRWIRLHSGRDAGM